MLPFFSYCEPRAMNIAPIQSKFENSPLLHNCYKCYRSHKCVRDQYGIEKFAHLMENYVGTQYKGKEETTKRGCIFLYFSFSLMCFRNPETKWCSSSGFNCMHWHSYHFYLLFFADAFFLWFNLYRISKLK